MGCGTGTCGTTAPGKAEAELVAQLAHASSSIDHGGCCAHCSGVDLDPTRAPVTPADLLSAGAGCPISIVAYRARKETDNGREVGVKANPGRVPSLIVDGKEVDAMSEYKTGKCGC